MQTEVERGRETRRPPAPVYAPGANGLTNVLSSIGAQMFVRVLVLHLDAVRVAFVPGLQHLALDEGAVGREHLVPDGEAPDVLRLARLEVLDQLGLVQVLADELEPALALLALRPGVGVREAAREEHVDALEHELLLEALDGEDALVAEQVVGAVSRR